MVRRVVECEPPAAPDAHSARCGASARAAAALPSARPTELNGWRTSPRAPPPPSVSPSSRRARRRRRSRYRALCAAALAGGVGMMGGSLIGSLARRDHPHPLRHPLTVGTRGRRRAGDRHVGSPERRRRLRSPRRPAAINALGAAAGVHLSLATLGVTARRAAAWYCAHGGRGRCLVTHGYRPSTTRRRTHSAAKATTTARGTTARSTSPPTRREP